MMSSCRVIVIDDNPDIHLDFQKILHSEQESSCNTELATMESALFDEPLAASHESTVSFELDSATQGQEGLSKVMQAQQSGQPFRLAFIDMRMPPGWDGVRTTQELLKVAPELRVVICTAFSDYTPEEISKQLGIPTENLWFRRKPFVPAEIVRLASKLAASSV